MMKLTGCHTAVVTELTLFRAPVLRFVAVANPRHGAASL